jgi:predicted DNA-binding transcriptional regulator AlpA
VQDGLLTRTEIARRLGISGERVRQLALKPDFPRPVGRVGQAVAWQQADIVDWARRKGRTFADR